jgi:hypothetical protein
MFLVFAIALHFHQSTHFQARKVIEETNNPNQKELLNAIPIMKKEIPMNDHAINDCRTENITSSPQLSDPSGQ